MLLLSLKMEGFITAAPIFYMLSVCRLLRRPFIMTPHNKRILSVVQVIPFAHTFHTETEFLIQIYSRLVWPPHLKSVMQDTFTCGEIYQYTDYPFSNSSVPVTRSHCHVRYMSLGIVKGINWIDDIFMTKNIIISSDALSFLSFKVCSSSIAFNPKEVAPFPAPNIFSIMFIIM